jgi:hypothetical protein
MREQVRAQRDPQNSNVRGRETIVPSSASSAQAGTHSWLWSGSTAEIWAAAASARPHCATGLSLSAPARAIAVI